MIDKLEILDAIENSRLYNALAKEILTIIIKTSVDNVCYIGIYGIQAALDRKPPTSYYTIHAILTRLKNQGVVMIEPVSGTLTRNIRLNASALEDIVRRYGKLTTISHKINIK
jgi:hypothetical protein